MPRVTPHVFVSSTSKDLKDYRDAAKKAIIDAGCFPRMMEHFTAADNPPPDECKREVEASDVVVAIVAHRYGSIPPGAARSITWMECEWAKTLLAFVVEPGYPWPDNAREDFSATESLRKGELTPDRLVEIQQSINALGEFKAWLKRGRTIQYFTTPESLGSMVRHALEAWKSNPDVATQLRPRNTVNLDGPGRNKLREILLLVFPKASALEMDLDACQPSRSFYEIVTRESPYPEQLYQLVDAANRDGWVGEITDIVERRATGRADIIDQMKALKQAATVRRAPNKGDLALRKDAGLMLDRGTEEDEYEKFALASFKSRPTSPLISVVDGHRQDRHDLLVRRLMAATMPMLAEERFGRGRGTVLSDPLVTEHWSFNGLASLQKSIPLALAKEARKLVDLATDLPDVSEWRHRMVTISHEIQAPTAGEELAQLLEWYGCSQWKANGRAEGPQFAIFLNVIHPPEPKGLRRLFGWDADASEKLMRDLARSAKKIDAVVPCLHISLTRIEEAHLHEWFRRHGGVEVDAKAEELARDRYRRLKSKGDARMDAAWEVVEEWRKKAA